MISDRWQNTATSLAAVGTAARGETWADAPSAKRLPAALIRLAAVAAVLAVVFGLGAGDLLAADAPQKAELAKNFRGPGNYLSWIKIIACWGLFLAWVKTTDWVGTDCQAVKLEYLRWNPIVFGTFFAAFVLTWLIPIFWIAFPLLVVAYVAPLTTYIIYRNSRVEHNVRVLTPEHLRFWFATRLNKMGMKIEAEKLDPHETGPPVKVFAHGGPDERTGNSRLLMARQSPGLLTAREILAEGLAGRALAIMLDYTHQGASMRTMVDGVWIPRETRGRDAADPALESLKLLCGLNPQDRQGRQEGTFAAEYESARLVAAFASQGTSTGERVLVQFEEKKIRINSLGELGMRSKLQEELLQSLNSQQGFLLFSASVGGGLRSTVDVALRTCDRFTREFAAVEEETNRYEVVENVPVTTYKAADGKSPADILPKFFRTEPNVAVIRDLVDAATVGLMCEEVEDERLMFGTVRAKDCAEALLRVLALGVPPDEFARAITAVVGQRLVRKLCESCKEPYAPTPQVLQQLGIPEDRVQAFYRPPQPNPEERREPCEHCGGIGYFGRTAIFELLTVGEAVRRVLTTNPKLDLLRQAARKDGMKSLQEEGVLLVAKGVTSLPELMRVLKQ
ncbi:MAG: Flp pilus assembly complex ATPase component TadA [Planctomycetes bacterium]|nr:Flp pilus assembly complex ATPase component TadA [Planctomycetota bacterium]MBU4397781.1 Flp pilus assembly complex ATPase component TadA [Planctomycetota bacterium]MCG2682422.1 Flp pilus assembly complex ATPase component TadA [Planctomycetales bacterium]